MKDVFDLIEECNDIKELKKALIKLFAYQATINTRIELFTDDGVEWKTIDRTDLFNRWDIREKGYDIELAK